MRSLRGQNLFHFMLQLRFRKYAPRVSERRAALIIAPIHVGAGFDHRSNRLKLPLAIRRALLEDGIHECRVAVPIGEVYCGPTPDHGRKHHAIDSKLQ